MCDTLAETIRDGIRYSLHYDDWDTAAYATAERWTAEGFVVIDSTSGISLMDGPEQTLEYAIDEFLACDAFLA